MQHTFHVLRPTHNEYAPYYQPYLDKVPDGDILETLARQRTETLKLMASVSEAQAAFRYAPDKWSIKQLLGHVTDGERVFAYRALCIARGEQAPLPGFDENAYAATGGHDQRTLADIAAEFDHARLSSLDLFRSFDETAWLRLGTANNKPASVRALIWVIAGHERHHLQIVKARYLK